MTKFDLNRFEKGKNYVIDASAGTGKTYSIIEMVKKLISLGEDLSKILIVTYTEKAAGELINRIRKECPNEDVEQASIGTIHSFCKKTIKEFCITSNMPTELSLVGDDEMDQFLDQYIREGEVFNIIKKVAGPNNGKCAEYVKEKFKALLNEYYLDRDGNPIESIAEIVTNDEEIKYISQCLLGGRSVAGVFTEFGDALTVLKNSRNEKLKNVYDFFKGCSNVDGFSWNQCRDSKDFSEEEKTARNTIKTFCDNHKGQESKIQRYIAECFANDAYLKWQEYKAKRNEQTFDDMLRNVREEIASGGPLLKALQEKYDYAIIDEFQDTNYKQWDVFRKIFLTEGHNIIVVGDPKQSIYAFQGADIKVYESATEEIENSGGTKFALTKNYRATEKMIGSINKFFESALNGKYEALDRDAGKPKLKAKYDGSETEAFWIYQDENINICDENEYAKTVCQTIVDCCELSSNGETKLRISDENGKWRNVSFADFTILARTRSEMLPIVSELKNSGIPYARFKDNSLFDSKECAHWTALFEAINASDFTGKKRNYFKRALYTEFFGKDLAELKNEKYDRDNIPEIAMFEKWREIAKTESWDELIDSIIIDTDLEGRLTSLEKLKSVGAFKQLGDYCVDYLASGNDLESLINYLKHNAKGSDDEDEKTSLVARGTDFDCVEIMTIHASKGLERPVVISVAGFKNPINSASVYTYHNGSKRILSFTSCDDYEEEQVDEWKRLFYVAYTRAKYVLMLPTYTALVRKGYDFISKDIENYKNGNHPYRKICFDATIKPSDLQDRVKMILDANKNSTVGLNDEKNQMDVLKEIIDNEFWHASYKHTYSSMSHDKNDDGVIDGSKIIVNNGEEIKDIGLSEYDENAKVIKCNYDLSKEPVTLSDHFPAGADLGNALHDIFENTDYQIKNFDSAFDENTEKCFKYYGLRFRPGWADDVKQIVQNVLGARIPVIHGSKYAGQDMSLSELSFNDRKNEVEFNFNKENKLMHQYFNGFIDLVFRKDGYYSIVDWKSDRLNDDFVAFNDSNELKGHVDKLYSIQRVLYSYTLIKWLRKFYPEKSDQEIFEEHFGGVYYIFLRGCNEDTGNGVYAQTWENFDELKKAYDKIVTKKARG